MKVLYVDCCVRGEESRTGQLARAWLNAFCGRIHSPVEVVTHDLSAMKLQPLDAQTLMKREAVCNSREWHAEMVRPALEFSQADLVVIAAPYWDLSFPSALKVWVEHMWVRNLTFYYENDRPVGLARARHAVYLTTSGSPIGANDFGTEYIRAVTRTLGIPGFSRISAEALDLDSGDPEAILKFAVLKAEKEAAGIAEDWQ